MDKKTVGGHGIKVSSDADYYYTYTWQIFQLGGQLISDGDAYIHLKDTTLPTFTAQQDSYVASSLEYKWAKSVTWDDIKVSWYDTLGLGHKISQWRETVWNPTYGLQVASQYKKRSQIDVYLPNGNQVITWCLMGSWPKVIRQGELTYTDSNIKLVEVTVTYDWANAVGQEGDGPGGVVKADGTHTATVNTIKSSCAKDAASGIFVSPSERQ